MESIPDFVKRVQAGEIDVVEHTKKVLKELKEINEEYHHLNVICEEQALAQAKEVQNSDKKGKLAGVPISVKDAICVKDVESTAGSTILNGFLPVVDATIIKKIKEEGGIIVGKASQDVFGFGTFNTNVGLDKKIPKHPLDKSRSCGGSSGGSCAITKKTALPHLSLAESTGGSLVAPASFCGVWGLCPTYGAVSRFGLMAYCSSLDKIGPVGKCIEDVELLFSIIQGFDKKDATSAKKEDHSTPIINTTPPFTVGLIKETFTNDVDQKILTTVKHLLTELEEKGVIKIKEISLPLTQKYGVPTYYTIAMSAASTNLAKYCGIRYGNHEPLKGDFNEYFSKVRSTFFNAEAKRRIIIGTFARMSGYRDAFYIKAAKIRRLIVEEYESLFKECDFLVSPTMPILPPTFEEINSLTPLQHYLMDIMTVGPNLAGLPHLNVPLKQKSSSKNPSLPIGALFTANHFQEDHLITLGKHIQEIVGKEE